MTHNTPHRQPIRRVALGLISDYGLVRADLLVCMVHAETDADAASIRETIGRLEKRGEIYNANGDTDDPAWKVTPA